MTTLYTGKGTAGPWACDDANVVCDGWLGSDGSVKPGPTCDGVTATHRITTSTTSTSTRAASYGRTDDI